MKCNKNRTSYLCTLFLVCIILVSFIGNLEQVHAPGKMGGGSSHTSPKIDYSGKEFSGKEFSGKEFTSGQGGVYEPKPEKLEYSGETFGYPSGSKVIADRFIEPKFGTSANDILLLNFFISQGGLKLMENKETFVEMIGQENAKLHSNEPLTHLENFINGHLIIYLNYMTKTSFNMYSNLR